MTEGWLEPLLDIVATNSSVIACPVIDTIQDDTFEYMVVIPSFLYETHKIMLGWVLFFPCDCYSRYPFQVSPPA